MNTRMVQKTNRNLFIAVCLFFVGTLQAQQQFSREQLLEDMAYLKTSLEETHYNLYAYTPKSDFIQNYQQVRQSIKKDSFSLLESISLLQKIISKANNGHTEIEFPAQPYFEYADTGGTLFPLELAFEEGKALIRKNWSTQIEIPVGAELLSINGQPIDKILKRLYPHISAERLYFKHAKMEFYSFPRLYWQVFGKQDQFVVKVRENEAITTYSLKSIPLIDDYESKRTDLLSSNRTLKFLGNIAYLNPGAFGGHKQKYQNFIDSAFVSIKTKQSNTLIIDLRNNSGGSDVFSDFLLAYIADTPFSWSSTFNLKTSKLLKEQTRKNYDTTSAYFKSILEQQDGATYTYDFEKHIPQPVAKRFKGKVYALINRQSHSQSAVAAAQIQDYGLGTLVGEETGEYSSLYASQFHYPLPQTGIIVKVSKGYIVRVNGSTKAEGVIPDLVIKDHLLDEKDEILEELLKRITK